MIRYGSAGWQTTMADLSLILFMVALAALVQQADKDTSAKVISASNVTATETGFEASADTAIAPDTALPKAVLPAEAEAVALYRPSATVPALKVWLAQQAEDPRLQLTILARYTQPSGAAASSAAALALAEEAQQAGFTPRIVVEPAQAADVIAVLSYDKGSAAP